MPVATPIYSVFEKAIANVAVATRFSYGAFPHCTEQWIKSSLSGAQTKIEYYPIAFISTCYGIVIADAFGYNQVGAEVLNNTSFRVYTISDIGYFALIIGK